MKIIQEFLKLVFLIEFIFHQFPGIDSHLFVGILVRPQFDNRFRKLIYISRLRHVTGFAIDHRKVAPGTIFGAFRGANFNGENFIADAIRAGAIAVVSRPEA